MIELIPPCECGATDWGLEQTFDDHAAQWARARCPDCGRFAIVRDDGDPPADVVGAREREVYRPGP